MDIVSRIPSNILIYIQEIAEKMAQGRATAMIGSGFSKNAREYRYTEKSFLDWNQLGDIFYKKLHGKFPNEEEHPCYYQNILKLASKIEQSFGRTTLDKLLLDNLPDEEYEPSDLHESLLKLNWTDIFTTNYDTLLERTCARVFNKRYQVVLNKDDLVYSKYPRIIKLHGSFPSSRPFIITEEDYRRYPQDFAVFVNTVRQSLIENLMCMIGFSGDDPNFLSWIGWIRDHLGNESASKIYLIGVFDIEKTEQMLYSSRNIILINMRECDGIKSGEHEKGLALFFDVLEYFQKIEEKEDIIVDNRDLIRQWLASCEKNKITLLNNVKISQDLIESWQKDRENFSDWFILPYQKREKIERNIKLEGIFIKALKKDIESQNEIEIIRELLYEFNWRREQCLLPVGKDEAGIYEKYLEKKGNVWNKKDCEICFSLLEYWRLHGEFDKWETMVLQLENRIDHTKKNQLFYEKAVKMFYNLECNDLSNALMDLSRSEYRVGLEFGISSLLVELGYFEKAILLLKKCLYDVRRQREDHRSYCYYSKEAYLIYLLENMEKYYGHLKYQGKTEDVENHSYLNMLKGYDCNPEYEMDYLIGQNITCIYTKTGNVQYKLVKEASVGKYIKFMDKTGMIFRTSYLFKHAEEFAVLLKGLVYQNPYLAIICTLRFGDAAVCNEVWQDEIMNSIEEENADDLISWCIEVCKKNEGYLILGSGKEDNLAALLPGFMPVILSGLVRKGSYEKVTEVLDFIIYILEESKLNFLSVDGLIKAVVMRLAEFCKQDLLNQLARLPLSGQMKNKKVGNIVEPFLYLDLTLKGVDKPSDMTMNGLKKCIRSSDQNKMKSAYIRILIISLICELGDEDLIDNMSDTVADKSSELLNLLDCYEAKYGDEEKQRKVKEKWLGQLEEQICIFGNEGISYCSYFQEKLEELLKNERFYHRKCYHFEWEQKEVIHVIDLIEKWADNIIRFKQNMCDEVSYYEGWYALEEILMEIKLLGKIKLVEKEGLEISGLKDKLEQLRIPFLLEQIINQEKPQLTPKTYYLLLVALLSDGFDYTEAEKILHFYEWNNLELDEEFLKLRLQICGNRKRKELT